MTIIKSDTHLLYKRTISYEKIIYCNNKRWWSLKVSERRNANASPCKQFFISSLTKDITLLNCIFDLVDNAISGAEKENPKNNCKVSDFNGFSIYIDIDDDCFLIRDNCGGIEVEDAINYVFKFGNDNNQKEPYSSSGFGIGMKRAFFKLGKKIHMVSCTKNSKFIVGIDVLKWLKEDEWNFEIKFDYKKYTTPGTEIQIKRLNREVSDKFRSDSFKTVLIEEVRKKYSNKILNGLKLYVNDTEIKYDIRLKDKYYSDFMIIGKASITIDIFKYNGSNAELGWYIYFNDLNVIKANKDSKTGWGNHNGLEWDDNFANGFYGEVWCKAEDMGDLPFTTTKEVDIDSKFYQEVVLKMIDAIYNCKNKFIGTESTMIKYKEPKVIVDEMKKYFNTKSAADVGRKTFDYYYNNKNNL